MTLQEIYIKILESNLINFIVMVWILAKIFKKFNLGKIFDDMAYEIKNNVESTTSALRNALKQYRQAKRNYRNADTLKSEILKKANDKIEELTKNSTLKTQEKLEKMEKAYVENEAFRKEKAKEYAVKKFQSALNIMLADNIKKMTNESMHKKIILDSLDELDKMEVEALKCNLN